MQVPLVGPSRHFTLFRIVAKTDTVVWDAEPEATLEVSCFLVKPVPVSSDVREPHRADTHCTGERWQLEKQARKWPEPIHFQLFSGSSASFLFQT